MRTGKQTRQERDQFLMDTEANALEARADFGEANFMNDEVVANLRSSAAIIRENLRFQVEMEGFDELAAKLNLTAEQAAAARIQLAQINQVNLDSIKQQSEVLGNQIKSGLEPAFEGFFQGLIQGGKSAGEVFRDLIGNVAQLLAQLAAKVLVKALFGGIFGDGGTVANHATGGEIRNYEQGGGVFALGTAVAAAMKREGVGAVPIVAHVGEEVLSTRNGDAQFYRSLKERGLWSELKQQEIGNYASGGSVGSVTNRVGSSSSSRNGDLIINVPVTVEKGADMDGNRAAALGQLVQQVVKQTIVNERRSGGLLDK